MQVDDAFVRDAMDRFNAYKGKPKATDEEMFRAGIEIALAVAAERGLVVPDGAPRMWAVKDAEGQLDAVRHYAHSRKDEKFVRVAVVEIKE
jgi:hypothetical protein